MTGDPQPEQDKAKPDPPDDSWIEEPRMDADLPEPIELTGPPEDQAVPVQSDVSSVEVQGPDALQAAGHPAYDDLVDEVE